MRCTSCSYASQEYQLVCLFSARMLTLTVEQKCDIATRELDELREDRQRKRDESERALDNHRVGL